MLRIRGSEAPRVEDFLKASTKGVLDQQIEFLRGFMHQQGRFNGINPINKDLMGV